MKERSQEKNKPLLKDDLSNSNLDEDSGDEGVNEAFN